MNVEMLSLRIGGQLGEDGLELSSVASIVSNLDKLIRNLSEADTLNHITDLKTGSIILEVTPDETLIKRLYQGLAIDTSPSNAFVGWNEPALRALIEIQEISENTDSVESVSFSIGKFSAVIDSRISEKAKNILNQTQLSFGSIEGKLFRVNSAATAGVEGGILVDDKRISVVFIDKAADDVKAFLGRNVKLVGQIERKQMDDSISRITAWEIEPIETEPCEPTTLRDLLGVWSTADIQDSVTFVRNLRDA